MSTHLVIPDPHATPDHNHERFTHLGKLVTDIKPDVVICLGDWADLPSLCSYDKGTKGFEGRRYKKDLDASHDALEAFFAPIKRAKRRLPRFVMLKGNHEQRIDRAINNDAAQLEGIISPKDLAFEDYGWEYVDYNGSTPGVIKIDGVAYAHFFVSGVMGRAIGGERPALQLLNKHHMSCTQGHVHTFDHCIRHTAVGQPIHGLVAGVYTDQFLDYGGEANKMYRRGIAIKRGVNKGDYDLEWLSMDRIKKEYK